MNTRMFFAAAAPLSPAQQAAAEARYLESRDRIAAVCHQLAHRYGSDAEELLSEAQLVFMAAHGTYDGSIPWGAWLHNWLRWELIEVLRVHAARMRHYDRQADVYTEAPAVQPGWSLAEWLEGLGADAAMVAQLVLDGPDDFVAAAEAKGGTPRNLRSTARQYLKAAGWHPARVAATFQEIHTALAEA